MPDVSNPPGITDSGDVDHDETSNRTHGGDDLSPATLEATDVLTAPKYPTRSDVPDKEGIYRVADVDGEGNFGIIAREI